MMNRTSKVQASLTPKSASQITAIGTRGRPLSKLRTIDETAELLNVSPRTVRRLIGCLTGAQARPSCSRWR